MVKILGQKSTDRVLGAHILGPVSIVKIETLLGFLEGIALEKINLKSPDIYILRLLFSSKV